MGEVCLLRLEKVGKKRARSTDPAGEIRDSEAFKCTHMKVIEDRRPADRIVEISGIHRLDQDSESAAELIHVQTGHDERFAADDLARGDLIDLIREGSQFVDFRQNELPCRDIAGGDSEPVLHADNAHEKDVPVLVSLRDIHVRSRCDDAGHFPLYKTFRELRILDLVADRDLLPFFDESGDIDVQSMEGDSAHRSALRKAAFLSGQSELEKTRDFDSVFEEHLVEVTDSIHKYAVFVLFLYFFVLLHHWGECHVLTILFQSASQLARLSGTS